MKKLEKAFEFAEHCFKDMFRPTGEPHIHHCYRVVDMLRGHGLDDEDLLVAALLHDICEDTNIQNPQIQRLFGDRVGFIVNVLCKNKKPKTNGLKKHFKANKTHKTFKEYADYSFLMYVSRFYMGVLADPYMVFIKISDQIDDMTTVELRSDQEMAQETQELKKTFIPLYDRIYGEDILTLKYKEKYRVLKNRLVAFVEEKEKLLEARLQSSTVM